MVSTVELVLGVLISLVIVGGVVLYLLGRSIKQDVEQAMRDATTEEREILRKKLVRAMFPPRFNRD